MEPIKVLVADDHTLFRRGIGAILADQEGLKVVGEAVDGLEAIAKTKSFVPDVILMDLNMPRRSGLEAIEVLKTEMPLVNILVLTVSENESDLFSAMKFGAKGYLLKNTEPEALIHAISHIAQGGVLISPLMATKLIDEFKSMPTAPKEAAGKVEADLTPREGEVLEHVARGETNKEIADSLMISENTVKTHLKSIMEKLHLVNRSQAAAYAAKKGLLQNNK